MDDGGHSRLLKPCRGSRCLIHLRHIWPPKHSFHLISLLQYTKLSISPCGKYSFPVIFHEAFWCLIYLYFETSLFQTYSSFNDSASTVSRSCSCSVAKQGREGCRSERRTASLFLLWGGGVLGRFWNSSLGRDKRTVNSW